MTDAAAICPKCGHANPAASVECSDCGILMVASHNNPYGAMSLFGALMNSLFVLITSLLWWAP